MFREHFSPTTQSPRPKRQVKSLQRAGANSPCRRKPFPFIIETYLQIVVVAVAAAVSVVDLASCNRIPINSTCLPCRCACPSRTTFRKDASTFTILVCSSYWYDGFFDRLSASLDGRRQDSYRRSRYIPNGISSEEGNARNETDFFFDIESQVELIVFESIPWNRKPLHCSTLFSFVVDG